MPKPLSHVPPPPPLDATLLRHPLRWPRNQLLLAIDGLVLVHVGTLIVVALYYLAFQMIPGVKYDWDHAFTGSCTSGTCTSTSPPVSRRTGRTGAT